MGEIPEAVHMWTAAMTVAPPPERRNPALAALLAEKKAMIEAHQRDFAALIDKGLAEARTGLDGADLRRFDRCIDALLGRKRIFHSAPMGLNFPFLPQEEYLPRELFPWMAKFEAHTPAIRRELEALLAESDAGFQPYVSYPAGAPTGQWDKLNGSLDWSSYFLWHFGTRQEEACAKCPETAAAMADVPLADVPGRAPTVFFSLLRPRSHIPAHVGVTNTRSDVLLCVRDTGYGVSAADVARLFTKYARFHRDRAIPGTGLGLYLSKAIVEAHGGSVHAESELGRGSEFTVQLPRVH